jgi:tRNA G18 (ribose-2'-O)-methylase SpoU
MSPNNQWLKPFLSGIFVTVATYHVIIPKLFSQKKNKTRTTTHDDCQSSTLTTVPSNSSPSSSSSSTKSLMDSPTLDQRILRKAEAALQKRTSRLIVVVERCTNDHNYSAILRTAEALGIQHVYIIDPKAIKSTLMCDNDDKNNDNSDNAEMMKEDIESDVIDDQEKMKLYRSTGQKVKNFTKEEIKDRANHHLFAQKALEWLDVTEFETTKQCIDHLKQNGYQIWSTDLSQVAVCLTEEGLKENIINENECLDRNHHLVPDKLAIVFGTEAVGCTTEMLNSSDKRVYLPLRGFADSLNLSVATALVIHQLFTLDPTLIGSMSDAERIEIRRRWYTKLASQRLLSKSIKQQRRRIIAQINNCINLEMKGKTQTLQKQQLEKVAKLPKLRQELKAIDDDLYEQSKRAVEDLVYNPPQPLGDMRRADEHRTTFVGKNTKRSQGTAWDDMPATRNSRPEEFASASFFRERAKVVESTGDI